jgi:hypothetical protein
MKILLPVSFVLALLLVHPLLFAQPQSTSAEDSIAMAKEQYLTIDIAGYPVDRVYSASWQPNHSIRVGYGRDIQYPFELRIYGDYSRFDFDAHMGMTYQDYSPGKRTDYAIYPAIVAFGIFELAVGVYYSIQDEIIHTSLFSSQVTIDPAVKKLGIFFHLGAGGTIHIAGPVGISLGLSFRNDLPDGINIGCRAGIKYQL